ncbi:MAG: O-antigen ligase family protein [Lachnospiraceae bacterium]
MKIIRQYMRQENRKVNNNQNNQGTRLYQVTQIGVTLYLLLILGGLPLFCYDGFYRIGDMKYQFFYFISIVCIPFLLFLLLLPKINIIAKRLQSKDWKPRIQERLSACDCCMILYGLVVLLSYGMSPYREIALYGYPDWHMGVVTQLLLIGIYLCISRGWRWKEQFLWYAVAVSGLIFLLGLLNRYAYDPLGMYGGLEYWNKTHLLATIGNINWYCGYVCILLPIGFYYYWSVKSGKLRILLSFYICVAFGTMLTQGSESGLVAMAVMLCCYFFFSFASTDKMRRFLQALVLLGVTSLLLRLAYAILQDRAYFGQDLAIVGIVTSNLWIGYTIVVSFLSLGYEFLVYQGGFCIANYGKLRKGILISAITCVVILVAAMLLHRQNPEFLPGLTQNTYLQLNADWGSGRGLLWPLTWRAWCEMPWLQKLFGVGADCYAPYMYAHYGEGLQGFLQGWWGDAIVANAHNEWLNTLITEGLLGLLTYLGTLLTGMITALRYHKKEPVLIGLFMSVMLYAVNTTASFQHVMAVPFLFVFLGMIENRRKNYVYDIDCDSMLQ